MREALADLDKHKDAVIDEKRRKRYFNAIVVLTLLAAGLLAGLIALGVIHIRYVARCNEFMPPGDMATATLVPEAPPVGRRRRLPLITAVGIKHTRPTSTPTHHFPFGNGTHGHNGTQGGIAPDAAAGEQCEPGSVYGGQELDELNHGYMALMQKALSVSTPALDGEVRDYYRASLRSIFVCGESMDVGQLELVAACKTGYVVGGDDVECDEDGSYGDSAAPSASA